MRRGCRELCWQMSSGRISALGMHIQIFSWTSIDFPQKISQRIIGILKHRILLAGRRVPTSTDAKLARGQSRRKALKLVAIVPRYLSRSCASSNLTSSSGRYAVKNDLNRLAQRFDFTNAPTILLVSILFLVLLKSGIDLNLRTEASNVDCAPQIHIADTTITSGERIGRSRRRSANSHRCLAITVVL